MTKEIRDLKQKYNSVDVEFKNEKEEKQKSIEKFKKSRIKAQKEADMTRNYQLKESNGKNETELRLNK